MRNNNWESGTHYRFRSQRGQTDDENETPIFKAVRNGNHDVVEKLIDAEANLEFTNENSQSVLDLAKAKRNSNLIQLLSSKLENDWKYDWNY